MNKIEQLIEKRENHTNRDVESRGHNIEEIIKDLQSLQEPTEERDVTLKISDLEWFEYEGCYCKCGRIIAENQEECDCGAKIKRIL